MTKDRPLTFTLSPLMSKAEAILQLAAAEGQVVNGHVGVEAEILLEGALAAGRGATNLGLRRRPPGDVGDGIVNVVREAESHEVAAPTYLNVRPPYFPPAEPNTSWGVPIPALSTLTLRNGYLAVVGEAPVIFGSDRSVVRTYSSGYNGLVHFYESDISQLLGRSTYIDASAINLIDDVWGLNYCHWIVDWLPRLTMSDIDRKDLRVIVTAITSEWQLETLLACGILEENIIQLDRWDVVQVRELIIPPFLSKIFHPGFHGAAWTLKFVREKVGGLPSHGVPQSRRIYISRGDAPGRRILNEDDLLRLLEPFGFEPIILSGLTVKAQASLLASAQMIVAPHGAGLTNLVFCSPGTRVVEMFTKTYGTCAFWILAASLGLPYATYLMENATDAAQAALHDTTLDIEDFKRLAFPFLGLNG